MEQLTATAAIAAPMRWNLLTGFIFRPPSRIGMTAGVELMKRYCYRIAGQSIPHAREVMSSDVCFLPAIRAALEPHFVAAPGPANVSAAQRISVAFS